MITILTNARSGKEGTSASITNRGSVTITTIII